MQRQELRQGVNALYGRERRLVLEVCKALGNIAQHLKKERQGEGIRMTRWHNMRRIEAIDAF